MKRWAQTLIAAVLFQALWAPAASAATLHELANGEHSFRRLGRDFNIEVPVVRNPTARLAFFNYALADRLGIEYPQDPAELEKLILELFAWEVDPTEQSPKKWFASYYLDGEGTHGDGRTLWTGELQIQKPDGKILYIDAVNKGVHITPLAPFTWDAAHKNGKQANSELVHSGIASIANLNNGLDSTADLFGLVMERNGEWVSETLRVGNQTRPAHLHYHSKRRGNFRLMYEYVVRRDLGLPLDIPVTKAHVTQHLEQFARTAGENAARSFDLHALQENTTWGNKTTMGAEIDLGGWRYLDAPHPGYTTMNGSNVARDQPTYMRAYLAGMVKEMKKAQYRHTPRNILPFKTLFSQQFNATLTQVWLTRLGLSEAEIKLLPQEVKDRFRESVMALYRTVTPARFEEMSGSNYPFQPSAYDPRKIFKGTMEAFSLPRKMRRKALENVFKVDRSWAGTPPGRIAALKEAAYRASVLEIIETVSPDGKVQSEWIERAHRVNAKVRHELTQPYFWMEHEGPIIEKLNSRQFHFLEINEMINKAADALTDEGLPPRLMTSLGPRAGVKSWTLPNPRLVRPPCVSIGVASHFGTLAVPPSR